LRIKPHETIDTFFNGKLRIIQPRQGYRFSVDALLLAEFVSIKSEDFVVDLGAGCGIISLFLAVEREVSFVVGLELQEELTSQAKRNIMLNELANVVVCNPPYRQGKSGRINPDLSKAIARHEIAVSLNDTLDAGKALLRPGGRLALIYPANRLTEVFAKMRTHELEPKRLQIIFPDSASHAKLAMIEGRLQGKSGLKILPPIFGQGRFSVM